MNYGRYAKAYLPLLRLNILIILQFCTEPCHFHNSYKLSQTVRPAPRPLPPLEKGEVARLIKQLRHFSAYKLEIRLLYIYLIFPSRDGGDCNCLEVVFLIALVVPLFHIDRCTHSNSEPEKCYPTKSTIGSSLSLLFARQASENHSLVIQPVFPLIANSHFRYCNFTRIGV